MSVVSYDSMQLLDKVQHCELLPDSSLTVC
jgi:hypothetical protein